jgi:phage/plasmid primase-like uncharacterized protein
MSILDAADGRWPDLLQQLGGLTPDQLTDRHQPCPACGGTDRYRWDRDDGPGGWFCNQCGGKDHAGGAGSGMDLLTRVTGWSFADACRQLEQHLAVIPEPPTAGAELHQHLLRLPVSRQAHPPALVGWRRLAVEGTASATAAVLGAACCRRTGAHRRR